MTCDLHVEMGAERVLGQEAMLKMAPRRVLSYHGNALSASLMENLKSKVPFLAKPFSMDELYVSQATLA